jgi:hypothetical protein
VAERRAGTAAQFQQLVDLLLVLDDRETHLGVVDRKHVLGRRGVLVQRHRDRPQALRRQHGGVQARAVVAHHHQVLTAPQARCGQATGHALDQHGQLGPGGGLPDAVDLLAQRGRRRPRRSVVEHQTGERLRHALVSLCSAAHSRHHFDAMLSL